MDLEDCKRKGFIKETKVTVSRIHSLLQMADSKEIAVKSAVITDVTISAYVSLAYDSLRESLEALCILFGYKVSNHICIGELVKTLIPSFQFHDFDRLRFIRNGINYYGEKVMFEQGKELIVKTFQMKKEIADFVLSKLPK